MVGLLQEFYGPEFIHVTTVTNLQIPQSQVRLKHLGKGGVLLLGGGGALN